jgi:hypothetical protein
MAKKNPASTTSAAATARATAPAAKQAPSPKSNNTGDSEKVQPTLDIESIGHTAGAVWSALVSNGELTLPALKKEVTAPGDLVAAAVGWLAREDKLAFVTSGRSVKLALK